MNDRQLPDGQAKPDDDKKLTDGKLSSSVPGGVIFNEGAWLAPGEYSKEQLQRFYDELPDDPEDDPAADDDPNAEGGNQ